MNATEAINELRACEQELHVLSRRVSEALSALGLTADTAEVISREIDEEAHTLEMCANQYASPFEPPIYDGMSVGGGVYLQGGSR